MANFAGFMDKFLIACLGNIGTEYSGTRHNAGFEVADALARKHNVQFQSSRLADIAEIKLKGRMLFVIKPTTYMNLSGKAVKYWMDREKIDLSRVLVVLDDLAIPLSRLRLRPSGNDGGHNGLKSIQETLGTIDYPRLRFGIGGDFPKGRQVDFVLGKWDQQEMGIVREKIEKSVEVIESFVLRGLEPAMNEVNKMNFGV
jgi:peptidyl-tRNA hydrolase, PTH1 family